MAKKSIVDKNRKILCGIQRHFKTRMELSKLKKSGKLNLEEYILLLKRQDKTARFSRIRYRNRGEIDGRPRGYIGTFGLSRATFRKFASCGMIAGVKKG